VFDKQCLGVFDKKESYRAHMVQFGAIYLFGVSTVEPPVRPTGAKGGKAGKPIKSNFNVGIKNFFEFLTV